MFAHAHEFCPFACILEMLFDFRVDVQKSRIPNSGNGAFLTFLGARRLKDECKRADPVDEEHLEFHQELQAQLPNDRHCMSVKLCGEVVRDGKHERPLGIGPHHLYNESDYERSDTAFFTSRGEDHTFLIRKSENTIVAMLSSLVK